MSFQENSSAMASSCNADHSAAGLPPLEYLEMAYIRMAIARHSGNKVAAAKSLGVSLKTIYNKLNAMQLASGDKEVAIGELTESLEKVLTLQRSLLPTVMNKPITVMSCCNSHPGGRFTDIIENVSIGEFELDGPATKFAASPTTVAVDGVVFEHKVYARWVGNWCWDAAKMEPTVVLELLNHLKRLGWECHCAESTLFDRWKEEGDLVAEDIVSLLGVE